MIQSQKTNLCTKFEPSVIHALLKVNVFALDAFQNKHQTVLLLWTFVKHLPLRLILQYSASEILS